MSTNFVRVLKFGWFCEQVALHLRGMPFNSLSLYRSLARSFMYYVRRRYCVVLLCYLVAFLRITSTFNNHWVRSTLFELFSD